jgi:hypothetical protein
MAPASRPASWCWTKKALLDAKASSWWMPARAFIKDGNKNRLRAQDIHRIVDTFTRQLERPKYARMVPLAEIEANDYNLNLPRYIDSTEPEDLQDIAAHLIGGIPTPTLTAWPLTGSVPGVRQDLFTPANRPATASRWWKPRKSKRPSLLTPSSLPSIPR